jgi:flagellar motor protein MotB
VVTLRGLFKGASLTKDGESRLAALGRVAAAHPSFPVEVVLHLDKEPAPKAEAEARDQAEAVAKVLRAARPSRVEAVVAGARAPVVDPAGKGRGRNARVEVVFVTPEAF